MRTIPQPPGKCRNLLIDFCLVDAPWRDFVTHPLLSFHTLDAIELTSSHHLTDRQFFAVSLPYIYFPSPHPRLPLAKARSLLEGRSEAVCRPSNHMLSVPVARNCVERDYITDVQNTKKNNYSNEIYNAVILIICTDSTN